MTQGRQLRDRSHLTKHYVRLYLCVSVQLRLQEGSQQVLHFKTERVYLLSGCLCPPAVRNQWLHAHTPVIRPPRGPTSVFEELQTHSASNHRGLSQIIPNLTMLATLRNLKAVIDPTWGRQSTPFDVPVSRQVCLAVEQHNTTQHTHPEGDEHAAPTCVCPTWKTAQMALTGRGVQAASCWFDSRGFKSASDGF